jgi:hypothetical protein
MPDPFSFLLFRGHLLTATRCRLLLKQAFDLWNKTALVVSLP